MDYLYLGQADSSFNLFEPFCGLTCGTYNCTWAACTVLTCTCNGGGDTRMIPLYLNN